MTKKEQIALIDASFMKLNQVLNGSRYTNRYLEMCKAEERDHRKHTEFGTKFNIGINTAARLQYVRNVVAQLFGHRSIPSVSDYFMYNQSVFAGYALFTETDRSRFDVFSEQEIEQIMNLDYSELVA